ncbi:MAG: sugar phosphate nucleotidyltransferase [Clostridia bacterium]|nr:sugar phosphate nucleotidyltransferase [Clostridia bacterium]
MKLNLIMPMGGGGTRFGNHGFNVPKPLISIYGKPFFYWATQSIAHFIELESLTFVVLQEHIDRFEIDKVIHSYYPEAKIEVIPEVLPGAVLTCLNGIKKIPDNSPILFNDCDHLFICNSFRDFCEKEKFNSLDGALLTFRSDDPRFSFAAFDNDGYVVKTVEKQAISEDAICGAYYFKNKEIFRSSAEKYLDNCAYSEFFMSGVYNIMADDSYKVRAFRVDEHLSFGTPDEFDAAQNSIVHKNLE